MAFSDQQLEELKERADLATILGRRVTLRKAGKDFVGLCPFHGERSPSFYVIPNKNLWHCFGCNESGDIYGFFMKLDGLGFMEAVKHVAAEAGFALTEEKLDAEEAKRRAHLDGLAALMERAVRFYEQKLWHANGKPVQQYLAKRGVSEEMARKFHLGFAGAAMDDLTRALAKAGVDPTLAVEAGLCIAGGRGGFFDRFHGRLITPIRIPRPPDGRSIALGGRYLEGITDARKPSGDKKPAKYINSPETPLYQKGHVLFGLDLARDTIRREERAVIVEGYFDVIGLHQAGLSLAVATCGTSLTPAHLDLLARTAAKEIIFLFDGDAAGIRAAAKAAEMCAKASVPAKVATLPEGLDPDDFARQRGLDGLKALLERAKPVVELLIDHSLNELGPNSGVEERVHAVQNVKEIVLAAPPGLARELYVAQIAEKLHVPDGVVKEALLGREGGWKSRRPPPEPPPREEPPPPTEDEMIMPGPPLPPPEVLPRQNKFKGKDGKWRDRDNGGDRGKWRDRDKFRQEPRAQAQPAEPLSLARQTIDFERNIAVSLLKFPALSEIVVQSNILVDFGNPVLKSVVERVIAAVQSGETVDVGHLVAEVTDSQLRAVMTQEIADESVSLDPTREFLNKVIVKMRQKVRQSRARAAILAAKSGQAAPAAQGS